jgi:hypothetical protein
MLKQWKETWPRKSVRNNEGNLLLEIVLVCRLKHEQVYVEKCAIHVLCVV